MEDKQVAQADRVKAKPVKEAPETERTHPSPTPYKSMLCAKSPAPVRPKPAPQVHNLLLTESSRSESAAVTIPVPKGIKGAPNAMGRKRPGGNGIQVTTGAS